MRKLGAIKKSPHPERGPPSDSSAGAVEGRTVGQAMSAFLYIVRCSDGSYYVGTTRTTLEMRVSQHNDGTFGGYTSTRRPVLLVFSEAFPNITDAIAAERQVKNWSRAKKEALIHGDFKELRVHARGWK
jgi:putative endonuclease